MRISIRWSALYLDHTGLCSCLPASLGACTVMHIQGVVFCRNMLLWGEVKHICALP